MNGPEDRSTVFVGELLVLECVLRQFTTSEFFVVVWK